MRVTSSRSLVVLTLLYMAASLIHFVHNAEFLAEYPNLPETWTATGVYAAWLGMTVVGVVGLLVAIRGSRVVGLSIVAIYAVLGMDSLGHYVVAPMSEHTRAMNLTILLEVGTAALVFTDVVRRVASLMQQRRAAVDRRVGS